MRDLIGRTLGRYRIVEQTGRPGVPSRAERIEVEGSRPSEMARR
jgi:hypothetical protein